MKTRPHKSSPCKQIRLWWWNERIIAIPPKKRNEWKCAQLVKIKNNDHRRRILRSGSDEQKSFQLLLHVLFVARGAVVTARQLFLGRPARCGFALYTTEIRD